MAAGGKVTRATRVLLLDGEVAAETIDAVSADLISAGKVKEHLSSGQMVIDLLLGGIPVTVSEVELW